MYLSITHTFQFVTFNGIKQSRAIKTNNKDPNPANEQDEDYNLIDEASQVPKSTNYNKQSTQSNFQQRNYNNQQAFESADGGGGGKMFQKSRNQQNNYQERREIEEDDKEYDSNDDQMDQMVFTVDVEKDEVWQTEESLRWQQDYELLLRDLPTFEEYKESKRGQIQMELFQLIKDKVDVANDQEKARTFVRKLRELAATQNLLLDDLTMHKVSELLLKKKETNDEQIYYKRIDELSGKAEQEAQFKIYTEETFRPLRDDDTNKHEAIKSEEDLTNFMSQKFVEQMNEERLYLDNYDLSEYNETDILSNYPDDQFPLDVDIENTQREIELMNQDPVEDQFSQLKRVSDLHPDWQTVYEEILQKEAARRGEVIMDNEHEYQPTEMERKYINEEQLATEEGHREMELTVAELEQDLHDALGEDLEYQYELLDNLMELNVVQKDELRSKIITTRLALQECIKKRDQLVHKIEISANEHASDVIPDSLGGFIKNEKRIQQESTQHRGRRRQPADISHNKNFKLSSRVPEDFEKELKTLVNFYMHERLHTTQSKKEYSEAFNTLVQALTKNKVELTQGLKSRLFEYAVITKNLDYANRNLSQINKDDQIEKHTIIDQDLLQQFFVQSLRRDNFDGVRFYCLTLQLGHLVHYLEKCAIDIQTYPLKNFSSALNFYINAQFKLGNVLIFTRFYSHFINSKLEKALKTKDGQREVSQLENHEKLKVAKFVFGSPDAQVASIRELFSVLVKKLGSQEAVDPLTKEDSLWKFVDDYTKKGIQELAYISGQPTSVLDERDLADYFKNHLHSSKAFERLTQVVLRLNNQVSSDNFINIMIQNLKEYKSNKGNLPFSFDSGKLRTAYAKIKYLKREQGEKLTLSVKTLEYFLFLFRQQKMFAEIIDICENFNSLSGASADSNSEIKTYYLSDALLQIPSKQLYTDILKDAVYDGKSRLEDPSQLTQMTKAMFLDGSAQNAVKFFVDGVDKMRELKDTREDVLVKLFDAAYEEQNGTPENMTYDQFKHRYLNLIQYSEKILKESYTVSTLTRAIQDKNYEEIEAIFQIYLLEKEESQILSRLSSQNAELEQSLKNTHVDSIRGLDSSTKNRLAMLRDRQAALKSGVSQRDLEAIVSLRDIIKDDKVVLFEGLETKSADELQKIFNIMSKDQVTDVLRRTQPLYKVAERLIQDENTQIIDNFAETVKNSLSDVLKETEVENSEFRDIPNPKITGTIAKFYSGEQFQDDQEERYENDIALLNQYQLRNPIREDTDPSILQEKIFNRTLSDMKGDMLYAINNRKGKVLSIAIEIFNKLQDQNVNVQKLGNMAEKQKLDNQDIEETLQKYQVLLNDQRSPIWSALSTMAQVQDTDLPDFEHFFNSGYDMKNTRLPIELARRESQMIINATDQLDKALGQLKHIQNILISQIREISAGKTQFDQAKQKVDQERDQELKKQLEARISSLYKEYQQSLASASKSKRREGEFTRQDKLSLMRDIFNVEFKDNFTKDLFPAFYSQELILFGLNQDIPEAVRIGEHMMSQNKQTLSVELQKAVKEYVLHNSERYQKAVKNTGLIDNSSLYFAGKKNEDPVFLNWDDPYWQDKFEKNWRRVDQYKLPSMFAWDHKKYGILGEVMDMKKIDQTLANFKAQSRFY